MRRGTEGDALPLSLECRVHARRLGGEGGRASANDNGAKNAYTDFKRKIVAAASVPSMPATPPIPAPVSIVPASPRENTYWTSALSWSKIPPKMSNKVM